mmetsp:Transcript_35210/g.71295  ORF Transcript_35210/g.71295 Transcript_35210/m.71295 type:complete len:265 (-) Transcript_35210:1442-2236(-)
MHMLICRPPCLIVVPVMPASGSTCPASLKAVRIRRIMTKPKHTWKTYALRVHCRRKRTMWLVGRQRRLAFLAMLHNRMLAILPASSRARRRQRGKEPAGRLLPSAPKLQSAALQPMHRRNLCRAVLLPSTWHRHKRRSANKSSKSRNRIKEAVAMEYPRKLSRRRRMTNSSLLRSVGSRQLASLLLTNSNTILLMLSCSRVYLLSAGSCRNSTSTRERAMIIALPRAESDHIILLLVQRQNKTAVQPGSTAYSRIPMHHDSSTA